ncbi:hypothetical protein FRB93_002815 [Tulasnella sp. JGI-2019a]|nr:hypothetical protein FRB93_002815 [Tulasnella sp. JGI-2019a]
MEALIKFEEMTRNRWTCFSETFASRVTRLEIDIVIDMDSLDLLTKLNNAFGGPLCPMLYSLDATLFPQPGPPYLGDHFNPLLNLLLGSKLKKIVLPRSIDGSSLLSNAHRHAPFVNELALASMSTINYSVFPKIRYLSLHGILSHDDYTAPPNCSELQVLHPQDCGEVPSLTPSPTNNPVFSSLRELRIEPCSGIIEDIVLESRMPALRFAQFMSMREALDLALLEHFLKSCPLLEDLIIEVNVSSRDPERISHGHVRKLKLMNQEYMDQELNDTDSTGLAPRSRSCRS